MAKTKAPSTAEPVELAALRLQHQQQRQQLQELEQTIRDETRAAESRRDGFDRFDPKNAELLRSLARHGVPPDRQAAFSDWQATRGAELRAQRQGLESAIRQTADQIIAASSEWRTANAEPLRDAANKRAEALRQRIADLTAQQQGLRHRITEINRIRLERIEAQSAHDKAAAEALAAGGTVPDAPTLPEVPAETPAQIEGAIALIGEQITASRDDMGAAEREAQSLQRLIDQRKAGAVLAHVRDLCKAEGVSLSNLRDALIAEAGPGLAEQLARDGEFRALAELRELRPEVERLRADNATLRDGVAQLTRNPYR